MPKGAPYERKLKAELEAQGYFVVRIAGGRGCADLVAIKDGNCEVIQVKSCRARQYYADLRTRKQIRDLVRLKSFGICPRFFIWYKARGWVEMELPVPTHDSLEKNKTEAKACRPSLHHSH